MTQPVSKLLFIGDIVGQPALNYLERRLPALIASSGADFVVANAENLEVSGVGAGMTSASLERLFRAGVQLVTGGNHSWDGPEGSSVHQDPRVLRPLNVGYELPGRGAGIVTSSAGIKLGVLNVAGRSAISGVSPALEATLRPLEGWLEGKEVDAVLLDVHSDSVFEKLGLAYALAGRVAAVLGTHTHAQTRDTRVLPGGVAYVSDVGMTGPSGGMQGYDPAGFVARLRNPQAPKSPLELAHGEVELGAVLVTFAGSRATGIRRLE